MSEVCLGIDLGTGSTKATLVDRDGRTVAEHSAPHPATPEVDPELWWHSVVAAVRAVGRATDAAVVGVGLTGQMHGVVLLDTALHPVRPAVTWADATPPDVVAEVAALAAPHRDTLGNPMVAGMPAVTLRRLGLDGVRLVVQPKDWLGARLTGVAVTDPTDASATLLWDLPGDHWHGPFLAALGLDPALFPEVAPSDAVRGPLTAAAAAELGLPAGLPVTVGRGDTPAALIGSGAATSGRPQLSVGTGGQLCLVLDHPTPDPTLRTHRYRGPGPDQWYAMAATLSAGLALEWVRGLFGLHWPAMYDEAFAVPAGADGVVFTPYVAGERTPHLRPDLSAAWAGLRLRHGRAAMLRAAFEGVAHALRDAADTLDHDPRRGYMLAGGGTLDPRWRQLLSDILGGPLFAAPHGGGSGRGAALSAAIAVGWFTDADTATTTAGIPVTVTEPRAAQSPSPRRFHAVGDALGTLS